MNASMKVLTPEQKWHAGRQADAFFGLLDQYNQLLEEQNKLKKSNAELRQTLVEIRANIYDNPLPANNHARGDLLNKIANSCYNALNNK